MGKGFGVTTPKKSPRKTVKSTLSFEDTQTVLAEMDEFLRYEDNARILSQIAIKRYVNGEGKGAVVAAPWQNPDPDLIPTHYMVERELQEAGLLYPTVRESLRVYKPRSTFVVIYWKQEQPEIMAACQIIAHRSSLVRG